MTLRSPFKLFRVRKELLFRPTAWDVKTGLAEMCSHFARVLFYIEAWTRINGKLICTQVKCMWLLPIYVNEVSYARARDINFKSAKKLKAELDTQDVIAWRISAAVDVTTYRIPAELDTKAYRISAALDVKPCRISASLDAIHAELLQQWPSRRAEFLQHWMPYNAEFLQH